MGRDDELVELMDATTTTSLLLRRGGEVVVDLRRPPEHAVGWYGMDGATHGGDPGGQLGLAFRVLDDGQVVHDVASVQKSIVAVLAAMAAERGLLAWDDPVHDHLGAGWSRAAPEQEAAVALRHLMTMTSGLGDDLAYEVEPGTRWTYSLGPAWHLMKRVVVAATGQPLAELTEAWLTGPLEMADTSWSVRPGMAYLDGEPFEALSSTAGDLGRFGELVLRRGEHSGHQLVDPERLAELTQPSQDLMGAYGMLWWTNDLGDGPAERGGLIPAAPRDAVLALGAGGQMLAVIPSRDAVVVRLGGGPMLGAGMAGMEGSARIWELLLGDA